MAEDAVLVVILSGMILLAAGQIVLRNFFDIGFIWSDEALRMMVLWLAVAGAVAASRNDKHINIDVLDRFLPGRCKDRQRCPDSRLHRCDLWHRCLAQFAVRAYLARIRRRPAGWRTGLVAAGDTAGRLRPDRLSLHLVCRHAICGGLLRPQANGMIAVGPLLILLALLGAPLFAVIAASAMLGFLREGIDLQAIAIEFYGIAEMPILLAIPLFTFAGYLLSESGAPRRLVRLTGALLGWMPAGLAIVVAGDLRVLHRVYRRLGRHHHRARRLAVPGPAAGRLSGKVQPRPDHLGRQPRVCCSRRRCR